MAGVEGERELEDFLTDVFEGRTPQQPTEEEEVVRDAPPRARLPGLEPQPLVGETPPKEPSEEEQPEEEQSEGDAEAEPGSVAWAQKKYGDDPARWAHAAYQQEQHISRLAAEKREAEQQARQLAEYAQYAENQALDHQQSGMPMSAQEEAWIEQGMVNPVAYAYAALQQGNMSLYNGLLERIAIENPTMAVNVGIQAQTAIQQQQTQQRQQQEQYAAYQGDFSARLGESLQRVGIDKDKYGDAMSEKIGELGEYDPYVQAIMYAQDPAQRDLALRAVYDLVRTGQTATRRARETDREQQIRRESELRREAASMITGSPHVEPKQESPFMQGMIDEWRRAGQWRDDEN